MQRTESVLSKARSNLSVDFESQGPPTPSIPVFEAEEATLSTMVAGGDSKVTNFQVAHTMPDVTQISPDPGYERRKWWYYQIIKPVSMFLVVLDFIFFIVGLQVTLDHYMRQPAEQLPPWILQGDIFFAICFVLDLFLRNYVSKKSLHPCEPGVGQLYLDIIVTTLCSVDVILRATKAPVEIADLRFLRFIRVIRLFRISRVVQTLGRSSRWVFEVMLLFECIRTSLIPLATIFFLVFILGLLLTMALAQVIVSSLAGVKEFLPHRDLERFYGSLWDTYFTLVTAIIGGAEWRELLAPLDEFSTWYRFAFSLLVGFMKVGALNIVAAVLFVYVLHHRESLLQREAFMHQERDRETLKELRDLFRASQKEKQGKVTEKTCLRVLEGQGIKHLKALGLTVAKGMGLFRMMDGDKYHRKDVEEFLLLLAHSNGDHDLMLSAMVRCESNRILHKIDRVLKLAETRFAQILHEDPQVLSGHVVPGDS